MADFTPAIYPAVPNSIREINKEYIHTFIKDKYTKGEISKEVVKQLKAKKDEYTQKNGNARYFIPYRKEFAKQFFPKLVNTTNAAKFDLDELFNELLAE